MNNRHAVLRPLLLAALLTTLVNSAYSLGRGQNPYAAPVISPITQQATDAWKLAGALNQTGGSASAVQIAPQWILTAKHFLGSTPPANTTSFKNAYGNATINQCFTAPSDNDLTLCNLVTPISTPAGFVFPTLVENPFKLTNGAPVNLISNSLGAFLTVGFGLPYLGQARFAWVDALGVPYDNAFTPALVGTNPPVPYRDGGDSGSPVFWHFQGKSSVALVATTTYGGPIRPDSVFTAADLSWMASTVASYSSNTLTTSSISAYAAAVSISPPWLDFDSLQITNSTPTSVSFKWQTPASNSNLVKRYLVTLENGSTLARSQYVNVNSTGTQSLSLVGLETNANYTLCVIPTGQGPSAMGDAMINTSTPTNPSSSYARFDHNCKAFVQSPVSGTVQGLTLTNSTHNFAGVGIAPTYQLSWTPPVTPAGVQIVNYKINDSSNGAPAVIFDNGTSLSANGGPRQHGERICVSVTPISSPATVGTTSQTACITLP